MANLRIVLVEPQEAGNVGAAARVMKNFGFTSLWIAGTPPRMSPASEWWASGADDVVKSAQYVPKLYYAIRDVQVTVATTSSRGRTGTAITLTPDTLASLFSSLREDQALAVVFGREDSGLTGDEIAQCQHAVTIPTDPEFPVMNLAQSVGVICYELSDVQHVRPPRERAPAEMLERLHERAQALLVETGFLHENNPDRIYDDLRAIVSRADLDAREVTIGLGMIRQIEWKLRQTR